MVSFCSFLIQVHEKVTALSFLTHQMTSGLIFTPTNTYCRVQFATYIHDLRYNQRPCEFMSSEPSNLARWIWLRIHLHAIIYRFACKLSSSCDIRINTYINLTRLSKVLLITKRSDVISFVLPLGYFVGVFIF